MLFFYGIDGIGIGEKIPNNPRLYALHAHPLQQTVVANTWKPRVVMEKLFFFMLIVRDSETMVYTNYLGLQGSIPPFWL